MDDPEQARERAYAELCRRMAGLRDHDPAKLRFFWGSLFVNVYAEVGGLAWADVEPLWQRWQQSQGITDERPQLWPGSDSGGGGRPARHGRSHRGGRGHRRRGWWREPPFPLPESAPETAP